MARFGTHFSKSQYISLRQVPVYNLDISQIPRSTITIVTIVSEGVGTFELSRCSVFSDNAVDIIDVSDTADGMFVVMALPGILTKSYNFMAQKLSNAIILG